MLGIPGLFSTLRLRQSTDVMTIHGSPGTLDVVVRMIAGLWGEGRAPIPLQLVPLVEGRILDTGEFIVDGFRVRHHDTESFAFSFESQERRHLLRDRLFGSRRAGRSGAQGFGGRGVLSTPLKTLMFT